MCKCILTDIARSFDARQSQKEQDKIGIYKNLKNETKKIMKLQRYLIIPVAVGTLGIVTKKFEEWLQKLEINVSNLLLQKTCPLGTRNVLDI